MTKASKESQTSIKSAILGLLVLVTTASGDAQAFDPINAHDGLLAEATGYFAFAGGTGGKGGNIYYITNLNDSGPGSMRDALTRSEPLIILFENGVNGQINLLSDSIEVNGNKTIWGRHRDGSAADIYIHPVTKSTPFSIRGDNQDVIIANLKGDAPGPNDDAPDFVGIAGNGNKVWVHHVSGFGDGTGNMDGFVDTASSKYGTGNAMITVSWSRVEGWDNAFGIRSDTRATLHHNYLPNNAGRQPKLTQTTRVHTYNNWVENWGYDAMRVTDRGELRAENNVFTAGGDKRAIQGTWEGSGNAFLNGAFADSQSSVFTPPYSYTLAPVGTAAEQQALRDRLQAEAGWQSAFEDTTPLPTPEAGVTPTFEPPTATPTPEEPPTATPTPKPPTPTHTAEASPTPIIDPLPTDINLDGVVDVLDVQLCVNVFLGIKTTPAIMMRADVNSDEIVDVLDVQRVVNSFLGG